MDYNTIALTAFIALGFLLIGVLLGSAVGEQKVRELKRHQARSHRRWQDEYDNLDNQLRNADRAAESWRAEAYRLGYKPTSVDV